MQNVSWCVVRMRVRPCACACVRALACAYIINLGTSETIYILAVDHKYDVHALQSTLLFLERPSLQCYTICCAYYLCLVCPFLDCHWKHCHTSSLKCWVMHRMLPAQVRHIDMLYFQHSYSHLLRLCWNDIVSMWLGKWLSDRCLSYSTIWLTVLLDKL